jgi:hypothetical protein
MVYNSRCSRGVSAMREVMSPTAQMLGTLVRECSSAFKVPLGPAVACHVCMIHTRGAAVLLVIKNEQYTQFINRCSRGVGATCSVSDVSYCPDAWDVGAGVLVHLHSTIGTYSYMDLHDCRCSSVNGQQGKAAYMVFNSRCSRGVSAMREVMSPTAQMLGMLVQSARHPSRCLWDPRLQVYICAAMLLVSSVHQLQMQRSYSKRCSKYLRATCRGLQRVLLPRCFRCWCASADSPSRCHWDLQLHAVCSNVVT